MSKSFHLGKLVDLSPGLGVQPPISFNAIRAAADSAPQSDKEVADKAVKDSKDVPSIWFVNFPAKSTADNTELLAKYMQNIEDYRSWASLIWWRTVFGNTKIPQDDSKESKATRSAYLAKVAVHHMKLTPWLALNVDQNLSKEIECASNEFHPTLIKAVLAGFVGVTPSVIVALESILESLSNTISQSKSSSENKAIVCERYEYIPEANVIRSFVRLISFSVTDSMRDVHKAKSTERRVKCTIEYNDYEANFNQKLWSVEASKIDEEQKKAADDFRKQQTVDCPP